MTANIFPDNPPFDVHIFSIKQRVNTWFVFVPRSFKGAQALNAVSRLTVYSVEELRAKVRELLAAKIEIAVG